MKIKPLESQTRVRSDHNTAGGVVGYVQPLDSVVGEEVFTAQNNFTFNGKVIQIPGDKWLKVTFINGLPSSGWVAIINQGITICTIVPDDPQPITEYITYHLN